MIVNAENSPPVWERMGLWVLLTFLCHCDSLESPIVPRTNHSMPEAGFQAEEVTTKRNSVMTVKMRIEEETAFKIATFKPRTLSMSTFCAMLVEYGYKEWEKAHFNNPAS